MPPPPRLPRPPRPAYGRHIGPGSYDSGSRAYKSGVVGRQGPAVTIGNGKRHHGRSAGCQSVSTGPDPARANRAWTSGGFFSARAPKKLFVPPKLHASLDPDQGDKMSLATASAKSRRNYAAAFRSKATKAPGLDKFSQSCDERVGPGRYSPKVCKLPALFRSTHTLTLCLPLARKTQGHLRGA